MVQRRIAGGRSAARHEFELLVREFTFGHALLQLGFREEMAALGGRIDDAAAVALADGPGADLLEGWFGGHAFAATWAMRRTHWRSAAALRTPVHCCRTSPSAVRSRTEALFGEQPAGEPAAGLFMDYLNMAGSVYAAFTSIAFLAYSACFTMSVRATRRPQNRSTDIVKQALYARNAMEVKAA
ncbi:MAG: hypothetical protein EOO24_53935 [Comamonadaceae bacterium]|nr:MAG: hypothetical protein EOO24_53935 [Comamonadaceae bacterium]